MLYNVQYNAVYKYNMIVLCAFAVIQEPNASAGTLQQSQLVTMTGAQTGGGVSVVFIQHGQTLQQQTQGATYISEDDLKNVLTQQGALQQRATSASVAALPSAVPTPQPRQPPTPQSQQ